MLKQKRDPALDKPRLELFVGIDMQLISPRPYQMMTSETPKLVQWFTEETNAIIAKQAKLFPSVFRGVCGFETTYFPTRLAGAVRRVSALTMTGDCFATLGLE